MTHAMGPGIATAVAIVAVGMSLRSPITSIAAVLPELRADIQLTATMAGLLASLPVVCFGLAATFAAGAARRFGINRVLVTSLLLLAVLVAVRPFGPAWWVLATSAGIGVAITAGNVLNPTVVRRDFPRRQGPMIAVSTAALTASAAVAAALTVPLAMWIGWRWALAVWALPILAAACFYLLKAGPEEVLPDGPPPRAHAWRMPAAWVLAVFFGLHSGLFYANTAWMPTYLPALAGLSEAQAGVAASIFQLVGIGGALSLPVLTARLTGGRRFLALGCTLTWVVFTLGLLLAPGAYIAWMIIGGFGQGGVMAMLLALITLRSPDVNTVREVSGMTQTVGYLISALAPTVAGSLVELTGGWTASLVLFLGMGTAITLLSPIVASRHRLEVRREPADRGVLRGS
ncbi:MFS transporter [Pseudactinotalea sp. HY158]|uniref:MFS transporter n=1 Tax=Pseudactinotalea sp. HY158 TaxID=2654547 RepID=UPI00129CA6BB|nr:MFS transporter [Pseudactinotalea sp. HY158]QGH68315.1 MFS transporter [Pseudactinotalea sp. HY158]